jgi:Family of unknown function (DUF6159)
MFDRFATSFALARSSWQVLRTDKQLIVFPILSGLGCLLVLLTFALPFIVHPQWLDVQQFQNAGQVPAWVYIVAFAYYLCNYFVIIFCNAALISCALLRFHGEKPTLADGFQAAAGRLPQILAWAAVSATVGLLLKVVENAHEKAGAFISAILGTAWTVLTYFVVPVLVVEKLGPFAAMQRSTAILKKTWGEALFGRAGIGFYLFLLALPGVALLLIGGGLFASAQQALGAVVLGVAVIYFLVLSAVGSALSGIFLTALYQYAALGELPEGFDRSTLQHAFAPKG